MIDGLDLYNTIYLRNPEDQSLIKYANLFVYFYLKEYLTTPTPCGYVAFHGFVKCCSSS